MPLSRKVGVFAKFEFEIKGVWLCRLFIAYALNRFALSARFLNRLFPPCPSRWPVLESMRDCARALIKSLS